MSAPSAALCSLLGGINPVGLPDVTCDLPPNRAILALLQPSTVTEMGTVPSSLPSPKPFK